MEVAIIDYKMSNLHSIKAACDKVGLASVITDDTREILDAKIAILPGVGAFGEAMSHLAESKLDECILQFVESRRPLIGICLGLQLLFDTSEEFGSHNGLGLVKGSVKKFRFNCSEIGKFPVPQIGWNRIRQNSNSWIRTNLCLNHNDDFMYFVHSYFVAPEDESIILSTTKYGDQEYCSAIQYKNIFATQFHPEKSGNIGLQIFRQIKNNLEIK
jgi:imidazole glycerol-phosphate synthase subunit HisH